MTYEEALAWLRGHRSMNNMLLPDPIETREVRIAQADAAMVQQAYWVAKAHREGLVGMQLVGATEPLPFEEGK